jgi:uncharacterized membrane protein
MSTLRSMTCSLGSFWHRGGRVERAGYLIGMLLLTSGLVHLGILVVGGSSWEGPLSFRKPTTFGLSFGLTLITIVWVASFLPLGRKTRVVLLGAFTFACVLETVLVSLQAWRGVPSHFNVATPFDALIARGLAAGGFTLVAIILVFTRAAFRANPRVPISLRIAIQIGFVALCGAMATGAVMIARGMILVFSGNPQTAYATGGTLKPTHAVTMHAILVLPALAWIVSFANWSERRRLTMVLVAASGYVVLAAVVAAGNFIGLEPRQLPAVADALSGLGAALLLATAALALLGVVRDPTSGGIRHS